MMMLVIMIFLKVMLSSDNESNIEDDGISDIELSGTLNIGNTEDRGVGVDKGQSSVSETLLKALFSR